jgi:hypothetical protein
MDAKSLKAVLDTVWQSQDRLGGRLIGMLTRVFGALAARNEEIYWYSIQVTLGNEIGDDAVGSVNITQEADFVLSKLMATVKDGTTGVVDASPSIEISLRDGSTDRDLQDNPMHVQNMFGTGQRPAIAPKNRLFRRNSSIQATFQQLKAPTNDQVIELGFWGWKIFDEAALNLTTRR